MIRAKSEKAEPRRWLPSLRWSELTEAVSGRH